MMQLQQKRLKNLQKERFNRELQQAKFVRRWNREMITDGGKAMLHDKVERWFAKNEELGALPDIH